MSLRMRLIGLVAIVLVISLIVGGAIACLNASRSVRTEMRSALLVGRQTVENAAETVRAARNPRRELENLVLSFRGNRHLRVSLAGDPAVVAVPHVEKSPFGKVPAWFVRLIGVASVTDRLPVPIAGKPDATIVLETEPHNETLEVWNEFNDSLIVLLLFSGQTIVLIYLFIGHTLRPLYRLTTAFEQIGYGDYGTRISGRLAPELARLCDGFNHMAARLAAADADNRHLNEQLLTLQEAERAEIARDLHDEIGPYLFAINIDAANISRLLKAGRAGEASDSVGFIAEAVDHMQRQLRGVVRRLQPVGLAEFGLRDAIADMVQFWRRRHPEIDFHVEIASECEGLGDLADTTIYRITQECLSNSLRHGRPSRIALHVEPLAGDRIMLEIADDGLGMSDIADAGFGLRGMAERVRGIGGSLTLRNSPGGGLAVSAVLPCRSEREHVFARSGDAQ
jgi:two-component system, NarL family, sensor histidine kinase UhpB